MRIVPQKSTEQYRKGDYSKMKKKLLALACMIACIFGLTACGDGENLTSFEQQKVDLAKDLASSGVVPLLAQFMNDETADIFSERTLEEIEYVVGDQYGINVDGYAFSTAIESFHSAAKSIGGFVETGEVSYRIDGDQIIIEVEVVGQKKNAVAEVIFSNDMFLRLESAALNPVSSLGELMGRAALNTLIGMGTVFVVLILISLIISCLSVIPKLQAKSEARKAAKAVPETEAGVDKALSQIAAQESSVDETDDLELAAVIAAAVAASEGTASTDGFVVRSIRRRFS